MLKLTPTKVLAINTGLAILISLYFKFSGIFKSSGDWISLDFTIFFIIAIWIINITATLIYYLLFRNNDRNGISKYLTSLVLGIVLDFVFLFLFYKLSNFGIL